MSETPRDFVSSHSHHGDSLYYFSIWGIVLARGCDEDDENDDDDLEGFVCCYLF